MILNCFFHQTLNHYFSYIGSKEKKFRKIWPLKVYSNLNAISNEKSCLISMRFLSTYIDVRTVNFSHLLNPDWSIQISRAPRYGWLKIDLPSLSTDDPSPLCSGSRPPILFDQSPRVVGVEVKEGVIGSSIIHLFL